MDRKIVVIEQTYEAAIEQVWEAITNKDQMKHWYFEVSDFKAEVGFQFQFSIESHGKTYLHKCQVVEANPITKIAYTWSYEGYAGQSLVTFELFFVSTEKTRLKLTHSNLDAFSKDNPEFSNENFNEGWKNILGDSLRKFVEMDSFTKSIRINASLKDIWNIVLNPDNQWGLAFGGGATAETDWKEGSPITWRDLRNNIGAKGIVEVHEPELYLQLHYYDDVHPKATDKPGDYYEKYRVAPGKEGYILSIEIGKLKRRDIPAHQGMWEDAINIIKELAEKKIFMKLSSKAEKILGRIDTDTKLGDLRKIAKDIKKDHELALELWSTAKFLPRQLAILIMDNKLISQNLIDQFDSDMQTHPLEERNQLIDWLMANQLMKDKQTIAMIESWENSLSALQRRVYWYYQARLRWTGQTPPANTPDLLAKIEARITKEEPAVQWAMNFTAGWIGVYEKQYRNRCIAIGEKTGLYKGEMVSKGCTPDYLPEFIEMESKKRKL